MRFEVSFTTILPLLLAIFVLCACQSPEIPRDTEVLHYHLDPETFETVGYTIEDGKFKSLDPTTHKVNPTRRQRISGESESDPVYQSKRYDDTDPDGGSGCASESFETLFPDNGASRMVTCRG